MFPSSSYLSNIFREWIEALTLQWSVEFSILDALDWVSMNTM